MRPHFPGSSDREHARLISERFFREAGVGSGQRVLELGSGVGDVTMLLARLVGPSGEVIGVERDASAICRAQVRAAEAGLQNVSFFESDLAHFSTDLRFDAVVGRWILQFLPDPVTTLRAVARTVDPGGIVAFQEISFAAYIALGAHLPLWSRVAVLHQDIARRNGVHTEMGPYLHRAFLDAGLPAPRMRVEIELGRDEDFLPHMDGLPGDLEVLESRLYEELDASGSVAPWFPLVGAWCRV